ncbi:MAG: AsmA family protein [Candidatus Omnitrophota bacterium]
MKRKILLIILGFALLCAGLTLYINRIFIPVKARSKLIQFLEDKTKRKVQIDSINYNLLKGFVLKNITLSEENLAQQFIKIDEISFNPQILPIIFKKIIIPSVNIISADINLAYLAENEWNFSSLIPKNQQIKTKQPFSLIIFKINIENSKIHFTDKTKNPEFKKDIEDFNLKLYFLLDSSKLYINFLIKENEFDTLISLKTKYNFKNKEANSLLSAHNFSIAGYKPYLKIHSFDFERYFINNTRANFSYSFVDKKLQGNLTADINNIPLEIRGSLTNFKELILDLNLVSEFELKDLKEILPQEVKNKIKLISGQVFINLQAKSPLNTLIENLNGQVNISNADIELLNQDKTEALRKLSSINGKFSISNDQITTDNLNAIIADIPINLKGSITKLKKPDLNIQILSMFDLKNIQKILPQDIIPKLEKFEGQANIKLNIKGPVENLFSDISGNINLSNGSIKLTTVKFPLENIRADIEFKKNVINANFDSSLLKIIAELNTQERIINILRLKLQLAESKFNFENGVLNIVESKNPNINLTGDIQLKLEDLKNFFPKISDKIKGNLNGSILINGDIKNFTNLSIKSELYADIIKIYDLNIKNNHIHYEQTNGQIKNLEINSSCYAGEIYLLLQGKFIKNSIDYIGDLEIKNIELGEIGKDVKWKNKKISGLVNAKVIASGMSNELSTLQGKGIILITNGYLGEINLFKGLFGVLSVANFESIIFKNGGCNFYIKDKSLYTDNLQLISEQMDLLSEGRLGFNGELDFIVGTNLRALPSISTSPSPFEQIISAIASTAAGALSAKVTGTIKEPKYKLTPMPGGIIKGFKNIQGILSK